MSVISIYANGREIAEGLIALFPEEGMYLYAMLAVIVIVTVIAAPSLFRKKCRSCGARSGLDAKTCGKCGQPFPDEV
ncbi:MAG: hypothetical protein HZB26_24915 [Candidatus Hydrogenedentes bacterium]|nr:hypothetical protein [Candidatus Hydrogenedentota bacterium]